MVKKSFVVENETGLHARPAGLFTKTVKGFDCKVLLSHNEKQYDAKSILGIMSACLKKGSEVDIECDGPDEEKCMAAITELFDTNFGE